MVLNIKKENCCGCGACVASCHMNAVRMVQDKEGFFYPQIDKSICVNCGRCESVCPIKSRNLKENENNNLYFGVQAQKESVRFSSSSGGFFPTLAQYVLLQNGVVYGAGYNNDMDVLHKEIDDIKQLKQIQKTKYVQSSMEGVFKKIEKRLLENRLVLFCGTPCQTRALKLFLQKSYERLITVDLICYGVPSPGIWKKYIKYLEKKHSGTMTNFIFRDKRNGDNGHIRSYVIDGREYVDSIYEDKYCMMYFMNLILRPVCHKCKFCTENRDSDFTIGDFWGIERIRPEMDDGMGTSVVIAHTKNAVKIWNQVKEDLRWFECSLEEVSQPRLKFPTKVSGRRWKFMIVYKLLTFSMNMKLIDYALKLRRKLTHNLLTRR